MKRENEFPLDIGSEVQGLGIIKVMEQEIPEVYFLSIGPDLDFAPCEEYYAVLKSASAVSNEAKAYGGSSRKSRKSCSTRCMAMMAAGKSSPTR